MKLAPVVPLVFALLLSACSREVVPPLPSGAQTVTGVLEAAELSAKRRGSFRVVQEGIDVYYAESSLVNLREFEGKFTTLRGTLEHNTDPNDLPVLVVESVLDVEETVTVHTFTDIKLSLEAPVHWKLVRRAGSYRFYVNARDVDEEELQEEDPILYVSQSAAEVFPAGGSPIVIDATRATRLTDDVTSEQIVAVDRPEAVLVLRFTPGSSAHAGRLSERFEEILESIELLEEEKDPDGPVFGTGSLGNPCGGSAGILCPDGYYCDVQDFEDNVGKCRKL